MSEPLEYYDFADAVAGAAFGNLDRKTALQVFSIYAMSLADDPESADSLYNSLLKQWRKDLNGWQGKGSEFPFSRQTVNEAWNRYCLARDTMAAKVQS